MLTLIGAVIGLAAWSLLIWLWMYVQRLPAMSKAGIKPQDAAFPGSLNSLPAPARQAADNYNHLMEQPTVFYAVTLAIQVAGHADNLSVKLAWAYGAARAAQPGAGDGEPRPGPLRPVRDLDPGAGLDGDP